MPGKKMTPAPIDRPISRAYLRQFGGWSTAYPPGVSDPTTLRLMENVQINRDGSVRVRPGLKYLSYDGGVLPLDAGFECVGSHETFFLNDGSKALLFAARMMTGGGIYPVEERVAFLVLIYDPAWTEGGPYHLSTLSAAGFTVPDDVREISFSTDTTYVKYVQIDNKILALSNNGEPAVLFFVGSDKKAKKLQEIPGATPLASGTPEKGPYYAPEMSEAPVGWIATNPTTVPTGTVPTANTLVSNSAAANVYTMVAFFTYSNEIGESVASDIVTLKVQRPWSGWKWFEPNASSEPDPSLPTTDPRLCADQLVVTIDDSIHDPSVAAGATHLNLYVATYSDQDPTPVEALLVESKALYDDTGTLIPADAARWVRITPSIPVSSRTAPMPTLANRKNYSTPPTAGQGIVAADRLILVYDPVNPAVIRWTSNEQGNYLDFTAWRGGGYKTLTSGNLQIPAAVKLWQNPQSVDTLTILCSGEDGESTGYYMAPSQIASQSEATNVMGFEETTATPGTTSPYGCEVANNALYHPLDEQLMKSTASNYNINHSSLTDNIANLWSRLRNKHKIVSSVLENRIYYVVDNPGGVAVPAGCNGNEIWVLDIGTKTPTWSRWLIPAISLRKVEVEGRVYMSVVKPDGIYYLDPDYTVDDFVNTVPGFEGVNQQTIPWKFETNTQGANRAHDAWAHLHQLNIQVGFFQGQLRYGVRGLDRLGQRVDKSKIVRDTDAPGTEAYDLEDFLEIKRDMKEWFFYAESVFDAGLTQPSAGQISLVQYRYTPISVNVGYAFGSVETFEYGMADNAAANRTTVNGVPMPYVDTARP
jgi:hypothetical protein